MVQGSALSPAERARAKRLADQGRSIQPSAERSTPTVAERGLSGLASPVPDGHRHPSLFLRPG